MKNFSITAAALLFCTFCVPALARQGAPPFSLEQLNKSGDSVVEIVLPAIDAAALRALDNAKLQNLDAHDKRLAIAEGNPVTLSPASSGRWQLLADGSQLWRLQVRVPGATDLHLGFEKGSLVEGASLWVIGADNYYEGPYTTEDSLPLWIPMVPGDSAIIEIKLPANTRISSELLTLTDIGAGFRDQFGKAGQPNSSGACNVNVVCPLGQPYTDEERALAYYEFRADDDGRTYICTATLLNNVPGDRKNYVLTAGHCMSSQTETASMRLYWNYQSTNCATTTGWSLTQNQTGADLRATRADADFSLVELKQAPDPAWNLFHAGWDATNIAPSASIGLHHPHGDVAKVTNSPHAPRTIYNCIGTGGTSSNTHWLTGPYDQGTTEGGSSGSGLWIPANDASGHGRRLIGVLSGGSAACFGSAPDNGTDCYGKFSAAWDGASSSTRLRDWLDPQATGILTVEGVDHVASAAPVDPAIASRVAGELQASTLRGTGRGIRRHPSPTPGSSQQEE